MAGNHECQQPTNRWEGSGGAPQAPSTPHQTEVASHFACLGWASAAAGLLSEIGSAPCSPRAPGTGAATSRAADGWIAGVAEPERGGGSSEPVLAQGLRMQKHLVFTDKQVEKAFRLHLTRCCRLGELSLVGLQIIGWLAAAGRASQVRAGVAIVARIMTLALLPSLAHLALLLYAPTAYRHHREYLSVALRAPYGAWLMFAPDAPVLGMDGAMIHWGLPHSAKLMLMALCQLVVSPLLSCLPFSWSYAYSSGLLALWMWRAVGGPAAGFAIKLALVTAYAVPLVALHRQEVQERTAFAVRHLQQGGATESGRTVTTVDVRRLQAWVAADPFAPLDLLLMAALGACCAFR